MLRSFLALVALIALGVSVNGRVAVAASVKHVDADGRAIRVFDPDAPVQSRKRGVCSNKLHPADFVALSPGVSWYYNWHFKGDQPPEGVEFEFIPMVWGDTPERLQGLRDYLAEGHRPRAVFVNNEPNLKGQAFISPQQSADLHKRVHEITAEYDIPLVGPHMAIGSGPAASITAYDPIQEKEVTYTYMVPFLKAFFHYVGDTPVDGLGVHPYKNLGEAIWAANVLWPLFKKPIWITEFAWWHAPDEQSSIRYLVKASDYYERTEHVHGYAWFKERIGRPYLRLLADEHGQLTPLGQAYVNLPVHDEDVYYRPGRLNAARYVTMKGADIDLAPDPDDFVKMIAVEDQATLTYNLYVEQPGRYTLRLSGGGPGGVVTVTNHNGELARFEMPASPTTQPGDPPQVLNVITSIADVDLPLGAQRFTLHLEHADQWINWMELRPE